MLPEQLLNFDIEELSLFFAGQTKKRQHLYNLARLAMYATYQVHTDKIKKLTDIFSLPLIDEEGRSYYEDPEEERKKLMELIKKVEKNESNNGNWGVGR